VVAGKGHERYQMTQDGRKFFDDVLASQEALISWKVQDIERALNCTAIQAESVEILQKVSTDTRALEKGDIFVALRGDNFDAHNFLDKAVAAGAGILVIEKSHILEEHIKVPVIQVDDTLVALGDLASYRRKVLAAMTKPVVVGLTGSSGKTTVKEMVASIFNEHWPDVETEPSKRVLKTQGNFNNLIGLPLSLLPFRAKHKVAVLEMGMNSPGEIARLVEIAVPDISCINNIHAAHLEGLHTIDGVARAKDEIFSGTPETSILVVNLDDVRVRNCAKKYGNKKISFTATSEGLVYSPDLWASNVSLNRKGCARFVLHVGEKVHQVVLSVPGEHNVSNALAAAAIAHGASVPIAVIASGLKKFKSVDKRMMMVTSHSGISVLNDTYNANPASMEAGLETLTQLADESSVAVLGDMLELGEASAELHHEIGAKAAEKGVSYVAAFGSFSSDIVQGAREGGMSAEASREFKDKQELLQWLLELRQNKAITERAWILVKASRGMQFETIVEGLMENV
jgi:MurE/MurF fusion protein